MIFKDKLSQLNSIHWLVILLSITLTFFAWWYSYRQVELKNQLQFDKQSSQLVHLIVERMQKYEDALWSGVAKIYSDKNQLSYKNWKSYVNSLNLVNKYPGINGMGIIFNISPGSLTSFLKKERADRPNFKIHPQHNKKHFLPITYIIPVKGNEKAVGLDMAFEKNRYSAALTAKKTGKAQLTRPIILIQDKEQTPGFLLFNPFYTKTNLHSEKERITHFKGLVYAPFIMKKLMNGVLAQKNRDIAIKISDNDSVLFNEFIPNHPNYDATAKYKRSIDIELYSRTWTFNLWSSNSFIQGTLNNQPNMILFGGILIDSLIIFLFLQISSERKRAIKYAVSLNKNIEKQAKIHSTLNKRLELALTASQVGVWDYNIQKKTLIWDDTMFDLYGIKKDNFKGAYEVWEKALHPEDKAEAVKTIETAISKEKKFNTTFRIILPNKKIRVIRALADVVLINEQLKKVIGVNWDITDLKNKEEKLESMAKYDALSQLKNRFSFNQSCPALIKEAKKQGRLFALLLIDIDDFKQINDLHGHQVGDQFICQISKILRNACRDRDSAYRLGGDEFAILSDCIDDISIAEDIAERIMASLREPFEIESNHIQSSCSIGIALFPYAGDKPDELITNADIALYKSKEEGKGCIHFFNDPLNEKAKRLRFIKNNLKNAATNDEFFMDYQPIININSNKIFAIEALARWNSSLGLISPDEFILIAEKNNLINLLGNVIIKTVAKDVQRASHNFKVSINCSSKQLIKKNDFINFLFKTLKDANISPENVILEVTETYLIQYYNDICVTLNKLHNKGIDIAIDDFGTGYSSLSLLANIPFQYLKIDREFIKNIHSPVGFKILKCIFNVANSLNKTIIAEGIETKEQMNKLKDMGIYLIQGYYLSRPTPIKKISEKF